MSKLFDSTVLGGMNLKNRFVRSATFEAMADANGACTARLVDLTMDLAKGGVGLIVTGYAYVSDIGKSRAAQSGIHTDALLDGLIELTESVHLQGGKIAMQIAHAGCNSFVDHDGGGPLGPSETKMPQGCLCRGMTKSEIRETIDDFAAAAVRVKKAGFDGIQLHGAHGYLISQFLSPFYNKRTDEYGGSLENRARFVREVLVGTKAAVGSNYPVLIKINSDDFLEGGFTPDEMIHVSAILGKEGIDGIEISGGTHLSPEAYSFSRKTGIVPEEKELYFEDAARLFKNAIGVPLILVGGIRSFDVAERVVEDGLTDYVSLCRPLIREPGLIRRWKNGDTRRATCISCNECFKPIRSGKPLYCVAEKKLRNSKKI